MIYLPLAILLIVIAQRLIEVWYANRNTKRLIANGAREYFPGHYPLFFLLHGAWLVSLCWRVRTGVPIYWGWLILFALLQLGRLWVIKTLGPQWTTRIIRDPKMPIINSGPYRYVKHPNYLIVTLEIVVLPLVFGAVDLAIIFGLLNVLLLVWRIRLENLALRDSGSKAV